MLKPEPIEDRTTHLQLYQLEYMQIKKACSPGFNLNEGEAVVQPCICLIITFLAKFADKGESHLPAMNTIMLGELLTTVESISNLLPAFKCKGDVRIFTRPTPASAAFAVELALRDCEYAYRSCPS
jgi:hypothetical protein